MTTPYTPEYTVDSKYDYKATTDLYETYGDPFATMNGEKGLKLARKGRKEVTKAYMAMIGSIESALAEADAIAYKADRDQETAINAALIDADARKYEADKNLEAVEKQTKADVDIAKMQRETEMEKLEVERERIAKVDAVNAQANQMSAQALINESIGKMREGEAKLEKAENRRYSSNDYNYFGYLS